MSSKRIAGPEIERLIQLLAKVPGLGPRSARRAALHLIKKKDQLLAPLAAAMGEAVDKVRICSTCGNVDTSDPCMICSDPRRDDSTIIVVEDVADLWALERAGAMNARFHVLGGTLSPLDGIGPDQLNIKALVERIAAGVRHERGGRQGAHLLDLRQCRHHRSLHDLLRSAARSNDDHRRRGRRRSVGA